LRAWTGAAGVLQRMPSQRAPPPFPTPHAAPPFRPPLPPLRSTTPRLSFKQPLPTLHAPQCARGTYKSAILNADCSKCPAGVSTPNGTFAATAPDNCTVLMPGYAITNAVIGTTDATECPQDTYRAAEAPLAAGDSVACTPCGGGLVTLPNTTAATSESACVVPPGFGWSASSTNPAGNATACPAGSFNPGYNRQPCTPCGGGSITTDAAGASSADACYTPVGHGSSVNTAGVLVGSICPQNTYGRPNNTYGLVEVQCTKVRPPRPAAFRRGAARVGAVGTLPPTKRLGAPHNRPPLVRPPPQCLENSYTAAAGSSEERQCLVLPGYGWDDGAVNVCTYGAAGRAWGWGCPLQPGVCVCVRVCVRACVGGTGWGPGEHPPVGCGGARARVRGGARGRARTGEDARPALPLTHLLTYPTTHLPPTCRLATHRLLQPWVSKRPRGALVQGRYLVWGCQGQRPHRTCSPPTHLPTLHKPPTPPPSGNKDPCTYCGDGYNTVSPRPLRPRAAGRPAPGAPRGPPRRFPTPARRPLLQTR
jgi:hypothetical protein